MNDARWVRTYEHGKDYVESIGGVDWGDAELPYPWHKCTTQSRAWFGLNYVERCACGAIRFHKSDAWAEKNSARRYRKSKSKIAKR